MKAVYFSEYGSPDVLQLREMEKPVPGDNDLLIRVHAASVNYGDLAARNFKNISTREFNMLFLFWIMTKIVFGLNRPNIHILGSEFSGTVEGIGKNVRQFKAGDEVFGYTGQSMGTYAEFICLPETGVVASKPSIMTFEEAAVSTYGTIMAVNLLRKVNILPGQKVLIIGASGGIGAAAVQIARSMGAEVTGICATPRMEFVKALGASHVIDYTREDFTLNGEKYDVIFDVLGRTSFSKCKESLQPNGIKLNASFKLNHLLQMLITSFSGGKRLICSIAPGNREDLMTVRGLMESGEIKALVDRTFPMDKAADAHWYVESGTRKGQVAILMA